MTGTEWHDIASSAIGTGYRTVTGTDTVGTTATTTYPVYPTGGMPIMPPGSYHRTTRPFTTDAHLQKPTSDTVLLLLKTVMRHGIRDGKSDEELAKDYAQYFKMLRDLIKEEQKDDLPF